MRGFGRVFTRALLCFLPAICSAQDLTTSAARIIVHRSVLVNDADWKAQPQFSFHRIDAQVQHDRFSQTANDKCQTFEVTMVDGSPYERLLALNEKPIKPSQQHQEQAKFEHEIRSRQNENARQRRSRIAKYESDRAEENFLMRQLASAFSFDLAGEEQVAGVDCYFLKASPNPSYRPPVEKARALTGMRGRMWIDKAHYHWVKVEAEISKPVDFGLFVARVKPGTRFELEQTPVGDVWLPKRFIQTVNASVLGVYTIQDRDETYWSDYRPETLKAANYGLSVSR